jgi:predicted N-acetyltransferase YhbS
MSRRADMTACPVQAQPSGHKPTKVVVIPTLIKEKDEMISTLSPITLRPMTDEDLDGALLLSQAVRWPHRREDWSIALALGHGIVAEENGQIIGSAMWWPYGDAFATCGSIIVSPAKQGRGLGRTLMEYLLEATGERAVLLSSTTQGHRLYQSFGFKDVGTAHQHQAQTSAGAAGLSHTECDKTVRRVRADDLPAMLQIDRQAFGAERTRLIEEFSRIGTAAVIDRDGVIQGFAMCRPFGLGYAIGPVIARTANDARLLIGYFIKDKAGEFLRVDITDNSGLGDWLTAQGLPKVGTETIMIRGHRPPISGQERIYGLASRSFG